MKSVKNVQQTPWGKIEWLVRPEESDRSMSIGKVIVDPGKEQMKHMHVGDEQCLITLSGSGKNIINEKVHDTKEKAIDYFPPYAMHSTINDGEVPLVQLMVSCPVKAPTSKYDISKLLMEHLQELNLEEQEMIAFAKAYIKNFQKGDFTRTEFPLAFCSADNETIVSCETPDVCRKKCGVTCDALLCPEAVAYFEEKSRAVTDTVNVIECEHGQIVLIGQVLCCGQAVGYLQGGYFKDKSTLIDTTLYGIIQLIREIANDISNSCMENVIQAYTQSQNQQMETEQSKAVVLRTALEESQDKLLQMEIKNHFLFNTLNSIAALSLTAERGEIYQSIVNLSTLFRNQLQKTGSIVTLETELEAQKTYMELMKLRFRDKINTMVRIDGECRNLKIPFNTLQPFIENSFVHGFQGESGEWSLKITCRKKNGKAEIRIQDNGIGMNADALSQMRDAIQDSKKGGTGMSCCLLRKEYGEDFQVSLESTWGKGTTFTILLPM